MKTIGLIGGMSWESTATYYRALNEFARELLGGLHSAKILLHSFDFAEIEAMQSSADWAGAAEAMIDAACRLERGGADCLVICTNTMHKLAPEVSDAVNLPLLHIGDVTADAILAAGVSHPLLLATRYTMEQDFYRGRLRKRGIEARIPAFDDRTIVHDVIYDELCQGVISDGSRNAWLNIIAGEIKRGADSVVFGCTEVGLLITPQDLAVPAFDTTLLHARAAIDFALE